MTDPSLETLFAVCANVSALAPTFSWRLRKQVEEVVEPSLGKKTVLSSGSVYS